MRRAGPLTKRVSTQVVATVPPAADVLAELSAQRPGLALEGPELAVLLDRDLAVREDLTGPLTC